jgi:hypothetical protein
MSPLVHDTDTAHAGATQAFGRASIVFILSLAIAITIEQIRLLHGPGNLLTNLLGVILEKRDSVQNEVLVSISTTAERGVNRLTHVDILIALDLRHLLSKVVTGWLLLRDLDLDDH